MLHVAPKSRRVKLQCASLCLSMGGDTCVMFRMALYLKTKRRFFRQSRYSWTHIINPIKVDLRRPGTIRCSHRMLQKPILRYNRINYPRRTTQYNVEFSPKSSSSEACLSPQPKYAEEPVRKRRIATFLPQKSGCSCTVGHHTEETLLAAVLSHQTSFGYMRRPSHRTSRVLRTV